MKHKPKVHSYRTKTNELVPALKVKMCSRKSRCLVGEVKQSIDQFFKKTSRPDGHENVCRTCLNTAIKKYNEKRKENNKWLKEMFI